MNAEELKPCPFCGETWELYGGGLIACDNCGAEGPTSEKLGVDYKARWNTRALSYIERLEKERDQYRMAAETEAQLGDEARAQLSAQSVSAVQPVADADADAKLKELLTEAGALCEAHGRIAWHFGMGNRVPEETWQAADKILTRCRSAISAIAAGKHKGE